MTVYIVTCVITLIIGNIIANKKNTVAKINDYNIIILIGLLLVVWSSIYAFRGLYVGTDTYAYHRHFFLIPVLGNSFSSYVLLSRDIGFTCVQYLCYIFTGGNWFVYQYILGVLTYLPIIYVIYKNSDDVPLSLLLYIFTLSFHSGFNGTRQTIAVSIISFCYYEAFLKKEWIKALILTIIAFLFHSTVILIIPFLLLSQFKINSKLVKLTFVGLLISFIFLWDLWIYFIALLEGLGQTKLASDYANIDSSSRGSSLLRAIVVFSPALLAFFISKKIQMSEKGENEMILIVFAGLFSLLSMKYWIFSRIALYFNIMTVLFIPRLINIIKVKNSIDLKFLIGITYFLYMVALLLHGDGHYYPYYFWEIH